MPGGNHGPGEEENGVRNFVIDPASLQVDRRALRVKTDNVDVTKRSLLAYLRGEPKVWSVVRVPTIAEEDDRRLHRERDPLINERVQQLTVSDKKPWLSKAHISRFEFPVGTGA